MGTTRRFFITYPDGLPPVTDSLALWEMPNLRAARPCGVAWDVGWATEDCCDWPWPWTGWVHDRPARSTAKRNSLRLEQGMDEFLGESVCPTFYAGRNPACRVVRSPDTVWATIFKLTNDCSERASWRAVAKAKTSHQCLLLVAREQGTDQGRCPGFFTPGTEGPCFEVACGGCLEPAVFGGGSGEVEKCKVGLALRARSAEDLHQKALGRPVETGMKRVQGNHLPRGTGIPQPLRSIAKGMAEV